MGVRERYEQRQKQQGQNGASATETASGYGGVRERYELAQKYGNVDTSAVNNEYISTLFTDANNFWSKGSSEAGDYGRFQELKSRLEPV